MVNSESPKKSFWQFPITLKFVVVWIFLLSLGSFWAAVDGLISAHTIKIVSFIAGFVYFYLAIGLADRDNAARILTSVFVSVGILARIVLLALIFLKKVDSGYIEFNLVKYPLSSNQVTTFLILNIIFDMGILYVLLRSKTMVLFSRTVSLPTPQETT